MQSDRLAKIDKPERFTQLDGLRGIAALVVFISHLLGITVGLGRILTDRWADLDSVENWLTFTPIHLFWNGSAGVCVFFVISGFVLALPFTRENGNISWFVYYPKRLARLYLPVWGSLLLAAILVTAFPRNDAIQQSPWATQYAAIPNLRELIKNAITLGGDNLNPPLWSLRLEVAFSILLPLYVFVTSRFRKFWLAKLTVIVLLTALGGALGSRWLVLHAHVCSRGRIGLRTRSSRQKLCLDQEDSCCRRFYSGYFASKCRVDKEARVAGVRGFRAGWGDPDRHHISCIKIRE